MKVLYLTGMYPTPEYPQKGIFCHEQVKALKELGIDVDVVVPLPFYDKEAKLSTWEYEEVRVRYIRFFKLPRAYDFHKTGKHLFHALKRKMNLKQYDLIHADAALPTGQAAMLISKKYNIPYAVHGHGLDVFLEQSYRGYKNCDKIVAACSEVFENATAVIGVSQKVLERIALRVSVDHKGFVAYNGVDIDKFVPKAHSNEIFRFITVGNLIPLKGHQYTIKSVKALVDQGYTKLHLDLVGRGCLEQELKTLVQELGLSEYITFHGYVPYTEVRNMMQLADAFVLPSYYEAFGCVYLEAMACGLPVIGCLKNGIDEVYQNGVHGYLIENQNQEQLTGAMEKLLNDDTRATLSQNACELVRERFTWRDSAKSVAQVYRNITEREWHGL